MNKDKKSEDYYNQTRLKNNKMNNISRKCSIKWLKKKRKCPL